MDNCLANLRPTREAPYVLENNRAQTITVRRTCVNNPAAAFKCVTTTSHAANFSHHICIRPSVLLCTVLYLDRRTALLKLPLDTFFDA
jgi:hypothetical protein